MRFMVDEFFYRKGAFTMRILVIDGQGGGLGAQLVTRLQAHSATSLAANSTALSSSSSSFWVPTPAMSTPQLDMGTRMRRAGEDGILRNRIGAIPSVRGSAGKKFVV